MNPCARTLKWAGGTHTFCLATPWARFRLEGFRSPATEYSFGARMTRLEAGTASAADVEEILEAGLVGGGLPVKQARALIAEHVRGKPLAPNVAVAFEVLAALFVGA